MDWNPYSAPQTSEQEKSQARAKLIIHCIGLVMFSVLVWIGLAVSNKEGLGLGSFFFGAVLGLILWLWGNDEKHPVIYMFFSSLVIGIGGFASLIPNSIRNEFVEEISLNPAMILLFLFGFSLFAGFNTGALIAALWIWNLLAKVVRWITKGLQ